MRIAGKDESVKHCAIAGTGWVEAITRRKLGLAGLKRSRNSLFSLLNSVPPTKTKRLNDTVERR
ncbi:MAG: hypothetical protein KME13_05785 [Myxacorys californica WJT36-NPBG1]|nr:hypothetical protein [Myxacorys californica WJT36-NPBG1]